MKKLLSFLKDYKKETILAPLFKLLEATFELFVPLVMASIIDKGIGNGNMGFVWKMGGLLFLLALVGLASSITAQYYSAKAAAGFATQLRQALFDHIQGFSFTKIDKVGTSTLITRLTSDINQVQAGVNLVLRLFLRSPIIVLGAMIMTFTIDVKSALVFVVAIPLMAIVVFGVMLITIPLYKKVQNALDKVLGITRENLTGVRVIRAFHQEKQEEDRFVAQNKVLASLQMYVGRISAIMNPLTYIIVNGAIIVLIYTGAMQVNVGNLSQGEVVAIINYMSQILVELIKLANLIITVTKAMACADRVSLMFEIETGEEYLKKELINKNDENFISFNNVSFTYEGAGAETLKNISFHVKKGETVGVIGGTGAGKTTLINLIPGFYKATDGEVLLEGESVAAMEAETIRKRVGVVPQKAVLFQGTIRSNLAWGNENASEKEMWEAIELAQAKDIVEGKEGALEASVSQAGKNLSGGQKQRLTIARAFIRKPDILILDDSASALDYATDSKLRGALEKLKDTTIFLVSQRTASIMYADKIIVLDEGEMVAIGKHEELLASSTVYQEIYYSQYPKEQNQKVTGRG